MASIKYKDNGEYKDIVVKVGDTLPIGAEVDYEGSVVPNGWEKVDDPNEYSTTEQVIGKWKDGKPIYRSVIEYTLSIDTSTYYGTYTGAADIIKSIDTLVDYKFYVYNGTLIFPIPNFGGTNNDRDCGIYIQRSYGGIGFQCFARSINNFNGKPAQIILEYTKTTD